MTAKVRFYRPIQPLRPALGGRAMLTQTAFGLALAIVAARCMLLETIRDPLQIMPGGSPVPRGAGAATSLVLDLFCCAPAILVLLRRAVDKTYTIRFSTSHLLLLLLAAWMALSIRWADDKFLTLISAANFVSALALLWAASQLVRSWLRLRLVAAIAYGLLLVFLVKGFYYKFSDMPYMLQYRQQIMAQQHIDPNSYAGSQFQSRIKALMGFNASPNSFAGMIVLLMTIGLGVVLQRRKDHDDVGWAVTLAVFFPLGIWLLFYTQSKAAMVLPVLVLILLAAVWKWRRPMAAHAKRYFWMGAAAVALAIAAVVGHGLYHGRLPTDSLNFRWRYWIGSWRMFQRHPLRGVGWENFAPHYLRDRLPAAAEEIRDPHNFIVRFFVELGAVGGILLLAWLLRLWWELTRPIVPPPPLPERSPAPPDRGLLFLAGIAGAAILINSLAAIDFNQSPSYLTVTGISQLLYLCAFLLGSFVVAVRSLEKPRLDDRPAPWILYGILIAVAVFLIHNLIEFSLFETGPLCLFCLLAGSALGVRLGNPPVRRQRHSIAAIAALVIVCTLGWAAMDRIVIPVIHAEAAAHRGDDQLLANHFESASEQYAYAAQIVPFNADYSYRAGQTLQIELGPAAPLKDPRQFEIARRIDPLISTYYEIAIGHDPSFLAAYHLRAILALQTYDAEKLRANFDKILELDPNEVSLRLEYAQDLQMLHLPQEALRQYQIALAYNDRLDPAEPKRLDSKTEKWVHDQIDALQVGSDWHKP